MLLLYGIWNDNSPQAIFKDPFRRGNNILVSLVLSCFLIIIVFTFTIQPTSIPRYCVFFLVPEINKIILYINKDLKLLNYVVMHKCSYISQVMCDAYTPSGEPIPTNKRHNAAKIFSHPDVVAEVPWYVICVCSPSLPSHLFIYISYSSYKRKKMKQK